MRNTTSHVPAVVDALVSAGLVDASRHDEAQRVVTGALGAPERQATSRGLLVEIAGYVGGALVVASVGLFLAQYWSDFSGAGQVAVLATIAVLLAAAGLIVCRLGTGYAEMRAGRDEVRRRLAAALLTAGAVAAGIALGRAVELQVGPETGNGSWPSVAGSLTALVLSVAAYAVVPSLLGQLAMLWAVVVANTSTWSLVADEEFDTLWPGLTFMAVGLTWLVCAERGVFRERDQARAIAALLTLFGAQFIRFGDTHNNLSYLLMAAVAVAAFVLYLKTVSWPYLVVGVLGVTLVVPEAIIDWTEGSLGPAGGVLVAGLTLLGASLAGFRVRKEATEETEETEETEKIEETAERPTERPTQPAGR